MTSSRTYLSIGDVLTLLREEFPDVTISKIRFLESQGLVNPERSPSGYRKFFDHDVERLRWVLRQQREHFLPLKVIRDRLADGELDENGAGTADGGNGKSARAANAARSAAAGRDADPDGRRATDQGRRGGDGAHPGRRLAPDGPTSRCRRRRRASRRARDAAASRWSTRRRRRRSTRRVNTNRCRSAAVPP